MKKNTLIPYTIIVIILCITCFFSCNSESEDQKLDRAEVFIDNNNWDIANGIIVDALKENPKSKRALYLRAFTLFANGKTQDALLKINDVLLIDSTYSNAYYLRSLIKINQKDKYGSTIDCDKALQFDSTNINALYIKGQFEEMNQNLPRSLYYFNKVLLQKPNDTSALVSISKIYIRLNNRNIACKYLYKASNQGCREAIKIIPSACNEREEKASPSPNPKKATSGLLYKSEKNGFIITFPKGYISNPVKFKNTDILMVEGNSSGKKSNNFVNQYFSENSYASMNINVQKANDPNKTTVYDLSIDAIKSTLSKSLKSVDFLDYGYSIIGNEPALWTYYTSDEKKYFYVEYSILHNDLAYTFAGSCNYDRNFKNKKKEFINTIETLEFTQ